MNADNDGASGGGFLRGLGFGLLLGILVALAIAAATSLLDDEEALPDEARELIEANYFRDVEPRVLDESVRPRDGG